MYRNCKFGEFCRFSHDIIEDGKEIIKLKQQLEELKKRIDEKDEEIKLKDEEIIQVNKNLQNQLRNLEERSKSMEKSLEEIKAENKYLRNVIETRLTNDKNNEVPSIPRIEKESEIERAEEVVDECLEPHKCEKCEFVGKNQAGLKIHMTAKHKEKPLLQSGKLFY